MHELSLGHSNKLIARKLGFSEPAVKFHVQHIVSKQDVRKRASAMVEAHRKELLASVTASLSRRDSCRFASASASPSRQDSASFTAVRPLRATLSSLNP